MQRFLESCAAFVYQKYGDDFSGLRVVLPNRRAALFFTAYLKRLLSHPVIGPDMITINELMLSFSDLLPSDRLTLVALLYDAYTEVTGSSESFDDFYFWGEVLLADFDDIDKYQVSAGDLFLNLSQLKDAGSQFDYLSEGQKKLLAQFWGSLGRWENFRMESDFVSFWEKLPKIYDRFREMLVTRGIGYNGMMVRDGLDALLSGHRELPGDHYIIAGLNALNGCERKLFSHLRDAGKATFLWDYDFYYLNDPLNNAGRFIRENLLMFPPPAGFAPSAGCFAQPKEVELVAVASSLGQAQVIPEVLAHEGTEEKRSFDDTALVLADESLLFPVLGAIPPELGKVNVTMGYPVRNSPVVTLLMQAAALLVNTRAGDGNTPGLYFRLVNDVLSHPFLSSIERDKVTQALKEFRTGNRIYLAPSELFFSPLHHQVFSLPSGVEKYGDYLLGILRMLYGRFPGEEGDPVVREMIWQTYKAVEKLRTVIAGILERGKAQITPGIFVSFLGKYLTLESVAFEGEPLSGLQVMGILETRCLDFDHLVIIGLNEEIWPRTSAMPSMIPHNLRKGFGLPGLDDQEAMYAYYFYRLIQRARRVTATWSTVREGVSGGELSRYGFQLKYRSPHAVSERTLDFPFGSLPVVPIAVPSGPEVRDFLLAANREKPLSPSAIINYLMCPLRFYFRYVARLREPDEVSEDIDRQLFGNIFHKAVENLYHFRVNTVLSPAVLEKMAASGEKIREAILRAFAAEYFRTDPEGWRDLTIEGKTLLIYTTVSEYIRNLLEVDLSAAPLFLHDLEKECATSLEVDVDGEMRTLRIGGKVDRIDEQLGVVRVVDYKTGSLEQAALGMSAIEELFARDAKKVKKEALQSLLYGYILRRSLFMGSPVQAVIYAILHFRDEKFRMTVTLDKQPVDVALIEGELEGHLKDLLEEIFSVSTVFGQTEFRERCASCPYKALCRRE